MSAPTIQAYVAIPGWPGANNHTAGFTAVAGTRESQDLCLHAAKGMVIAGLHTLTNDELAQEIRSDFETDKRRRDQIALGAPRMPKPSVEFVNHTLLGGNLCVYGRSL